MASRAQYSVSSSMNTKLNAPRRVGSTVSAAASTDRSGYAVSSEVTSAVSLVAPISSPGCTAAASRASSAVLTRLPLWARAMVVPVAVARRVGWAFSQFDAPVVE